MGWAEGDMVGVALIIEPDEMLQLSLEANFRCIDKTMIRKFEARLAHNLAVVSSNPSPSTWTSGSERNPTHK